MDLKNIEDYVSRATQASLEAKQEFYRTHTKDVISVAKLLGETIQNDGRILIFGNGGSAADAQHMAAEMVGRMLIERKKPLSALALTTDSSALTAIANDYSYEQVFELQLRGLGRRGDVAIAISTSGNSKNVIRAVEAAKEMGIKVVSFTGGSGGKLKSMSDFSLNVSLGKHSSMIQETHITIVHLLVDLMDRFFLPSNYVAR